LQLYSLLINNVDVGEAVVGLTFVIKINLGRRANIEAALVTSPSLQEPHDNSVEDLTTDQHRLITAPAEIR
jgi:hypothetical protein